MDRKQELLEMEQAKWAAFKALLDQVPDERCDEPTLNPDGWSVKDLIWHMRGWDEECARELEAVRSGTFEDLSDWESDRKNAIFLEEGRARDITTVRREAARSREKAVEQMVQLEEITPAAEEWFVESALRHLDDHEPELRRFIETL